MIQFLNILGDVMRIATFQWRDERRDAGHHEEWPHPGRWAPPATGSHFAVTAPDGAASGIAFSGASAHLSAGNAEIAVGDQHGHAHTAGASRRGRNWPGPWRKTPGRVLGTSLVRLYQLTLSGFVGNSCRLLPTCSEYAHEAIARHGLWAGGWMGLFRVLRCGPFGTHGIDLVPEVLAPRYAWFMPWRYWGIGRKRGEAQG